MDATAATLKLLTQLVASVLGVCLLLFALLAACAGAGCLQ